MTCGECGKQRSQRQQMGTGKITEYILGEDHGLILGRSSLRCLLASKQRHRVGQAPRQISTDNQIINFIQTVFSDHKQELNKLQIFRYLKTLLGTSLVVQWLRIRLPIQGTQVRALVQEDPACRRAAKPVCHNY